MLPDIDEMALDLVLVKARALLAVFMMGPLLMVATHPHRSFELLFMATPAGLLLAALPYLTNYARFHLAVRVHTFPAAFGFGFGAFLWQRRRFAQARGQRLGDADAARYALVWECELLPRAGFRDELRALREAWRTAQAGAAQGVARLQCAPSVGALFREADALNDVLHAKLHDVCVAHGGDFHRADIKGEARALQKVFRTYKGDWRRLNDLCRSSLKFETVAQMAACLCAIGEDAELVVVPSSDDKMRLREDFDATKSGGYRDVQLTVLLDTAEARSRGVHKHLAEVQLHFAPIIALKSEGGHKNYVLRRNLSGQ